MLISRVTALLALTSGAFRFHETVDEIEQREQNTAHEQHGAEQVLQRPQEVDAREKAEKEWGSPSGVSEPPILATRKMKNKKTWTLK